MTIEFDDIPTGTRTPGVYTEIDDSRIKGLVKKPIRKPAPGEPADDCSDPLANDECTVLLIHSDTVDGSGIFTDSGAGPNCPHTINKTGNPVHKDVQKKFCATSIYFDGSGNYLEIPSHSDFAFGLGDWTIDFQVNFSSFDGSTLVSIKDYIDGLTFRTNEPGCSNIGGYINNTAFGGGWSPFIGVWYHLALVREGNNMNLFIEGVNQYAVDVTGLSISQGILRIAEYLSGATVNKLNAYIDEFRVSKGIARWTSNFSSPTAPYGYTCA